MVAAIARSYGDSGLPLADLIQEGVVGLHRALQRFDPGAGVRLATYAAPVIQGSIQRAVANGARVIRLPVDAQHKLARIRHTEQLAPRAPLDEVAIKVGLAKSEIERLKLSSLPLSSLDAPAEIAVDPRRSRHAPSASAASVEDELLKAEYVAQTRGAVAKLGEREREIIERRYGLGGWPVQTLRAIGRSLGLSGERVRKIEAESLEKLARLLDDFNPAT